MLRVAQERKKEKKKERKKEKKKERKKEREKEGEKEREEEGERERRRKKERGNPIWSLKNEGECNLGEKCCRGSSNDFQRLFQFIERCKQRLC